MRTSLALVAVCLFVAAVFSGCRPGSDIKSRVAAQNKPLPTTPLADFGGKSVGGNATAEEAVKSFVKAILDKNEKEIKALYAPDCTLRAEVLIANTENWRNSSRNLADYGVVSKGDNTFVVQQKESLEALKFQFKNIDGKYLFVGGGPL